MRVLPKHVTVACASDGGRHQCRQPREEVARAPKFEGQCKELCGYVYDHWSSCEAANQYTRMTSEIYEHIKRTYEHGADMATALQTMMVPEFVYPPEPVINTTQAEIEMWENCLDKQLKREFTMAANLGNAYSLIYGQCSNALCIQLQLRGNHAATEDARVAVGLLKSMWQVLFGELEAPIALWRTKA